ncbi:MAG TPA: serine/threonine-protein kinase, partial [Candidatus Wallbacteria bacterium]|nr:serine/threonine-protein kinase [Candidatus Wallbacteria bacterium]
MQDSTVRQSGADAASKKNITLNDVSYEVVERISVSSGEADLYIILDANKEKCVLKYYRFNIKPKEEVMNILKNNSDGRAVKLIDYGQSANGRYYEIQQYAKYGDLSTYMKENPKISLKFIWEFITELNDCFQSIHALNIIHRDIKPSNILISEITPLKIALTDFGISSVSELSMRQTTFAGTFIYIPPESVLLTEQNENGPGGVTNKKSEEDIVTSKASDYWAMGLIILEMLTGRNPYQNIKNFSLLFGRVKSEPVPLEGVSDDFIDLLKGLLTKDPKKRWGFKEVSGWLAGRRDIPVYFETAEQLNPKQFNYKPYRFMDKDHFELRELAVTMAGNWPLALAAFSGGELKEWINSQLNDRVSSSLIDNLGKDRSLSDDARLFDFICRVNPEPEFIYKGIAISDSGLLEIAKKMSEKNASDSEKNLLIDILKYNIVAKFYELSDPANPRLETDRKAAAEACEFGSPEDMALAFLINHDGVFLKSVIKKIKEKFVGSLVIKAAEGYKSVAEMSRKAVEIYENGIFTTRDIIKFASLPPDCFVSRSNLVEMHDKAVEKVSELIEKYDIHGGLITIGD